MEVDDESKVNVGNEDNEEKIGLQYDDWNGVDEIESLCFGCGNNGMTRLMLHKIPHFKELIIASFCCEHCGERNNEVTFGGEIQPQGSICTLNVCCAKDLDRQIIKSDTANVRIPELDFDIPPLTQKGEITTIEGMLSRAAKSLLLYQDERMTQVPEVAIVVAQVLVKVMQYSSGESFPFQVVVDDPAGNSYVENLMAPAKDPQLQISNYKRTAEQDLALGLSPEIETGVFKDDKESNLMSLIGDRPFGELTSKFGNEYSIEGTLNERLGKTEAISIPSLCPHCGKEGESLTALTDIPHFKELIIMAFNCNHCGFRNNEVKPGGAVPDEGTEVKLRVTDEGDLKRDILKSDSCMVMIPELELELGCGTLGGVYTTTEGLLDKIYCSLRDNNPFAVGDSSELHHSNNNEVSSKKTTFQNFLNKLRSFSKGEVLPFTLILRDPLGNSFVSAPLGSFLPPESDTNLTIVNFIRSYEENEEFGLNDINTRDYETGVEDVPIFADRLTHVLPKGADHPNFYAKGMDDSTPGGEFITTTTTTSTITSTMIDENNATNTMDTDTVTIPHGWTAAVKQDDEIGIVQFPRHNESTVDTNSEQFIDALPYPNYGKRSFSPGDFDLKFDPREEFSGKRDGFVYRMGAQGLGYYEDVKLLIS